MMGRCTLTVLLLGWAVSAQAIVNVESLRAGEPLVGWSGAVDAALNGQAGNTRTQTTHLGARLEWHRDALTNFALLRYSHGQSGGVEDTDQLFAHARHIHRRTERLAYEEFIQAQRDPFARLAFRGLIGAGLRLTLTPPTDQRTALHLGAGGFYSQERLSARAGVSDSGTETLWRLNTYISYLQRLNDQVRVLSTTYYQPAVEDVGDYRLLEEATLSVKMTERLSLDLSLNLSYDSDPPQAVKQTDTTYSTGLQYAF